MNVGNLLKTSMWSLLVQAAAVVVILWIGYDALTEDRPLPDVPTVVTDGFTIETTGLSPAPTFTEAEWLKDDDGNSSLQFRNPQENTLIEIRFNGLPKSCEFAESVEDESQCLLQLHLDGTSNQTIGVGSLELNPLHYTSLFIDQIGINVIELSGEFSFTAATPENTEIHVHGRFENLVQPG